jgi:hypothetical protein
MENKMATAKCPNCEHIVHLGAKPKISQNFICQFCETDLELVWLIPPELDWPLDDLDEDMFGDDGLYDYDSEFEEYEEVD